MRMTSSKYVKLNNGANTQLTGSSVKRRSISFSLVTQALGTQAAAGVIVGNQQTNSSTDPNAVFAIVATANNPFTADVDAHGDCVQKEWHCWAGNASLAMIVTEVIDTELEET